MLSSTKREDKLRHFRCSRNMIGACESESSLGHTIYDRAFPILNDSAAAGAPDLTEPFSSIPAHSRQNDPDRRCAERVGDAGEQRIGRWPDSPDRRRRVQPQLPGTRHSRENEVVSTGRDVYAVL